MTASSRRPSSTSGQPEHVVAPARRTAFSRHRRQRTQERGWDAGQQRLSQGGPFVRFATPSTSPS